MIMQFYSEISNINRVGEVWIEYSSELEVYFGVCFNNCNACHILV